MPKNDYFIIFWALPRHKKAASGCALYLLLRCAPQKDAAAIPNAKSGYLQKQFSKKNRPKLGKQNHKLA